MVREGRELRGPVVYWMSRDQRAKDNWALEFALHKAHKNNVPSVAVFCFSTDYPQLTLRSFVFMLGGLQVLAKNLNERHIPFILLIGNPVERIPEFVKEVEAGCLICDFDPLKWKREWLRGVAEKIQVPFFQVDAHNVVPCWLASDHKEYAARTFRPRLLRKLDTFFSDYPPGLENPMPWPGRVPEQDWNTITNFQKHLLPVDPVPLIPGEDEAMSVLEKFLEERLASYDRERNNPLSGMSSGLSPYIHFGHISAQRILLELDQIRIDMPSENAFREQVLVRRELSENYCWYEPSYDMVDGFPNWARKTLDKHLYDSRPYLYDKQELEYGMTHDALWNAAQREMVVSGSMHGYLRMYWAKKILEWTASPEEAMGYALEFNDRYQVDGRDPNGYTGVAWCIGGVHDRPWKERPVFGQIRYMSYGGCRRKFDVEAYIDHWSGKEEDR